MNENTITIKINADGSMAVNGINQVNGAMKNMETETQGIVSKFKDHWIGITGAITGAIYAMKKAWDLAEMASQFQEQMTSLNALSSAYGITAKSLIASVKEASGGLISMADAAKVSAKSLLEGMNPEQLVQFTRIVKETTNVTGDSVANSFERISQAAAVGQERTLRQMGIIVDLQGAYKKYAESIGTTAENLNEATRQQIGINAVLAQGSEIMQRLGNTNDSTNDKMERFMVMIKDLKLELGDLFIRAGAAMIGVFHAIDLGLVEIANGLIKPFAIIEKGLNMIGVKSDYFKNLSTTLTETNKDLYKGMIDSFNVTIAKSDELVQAQKGIVAQAEQTHVINPQIEKKRIEDVTKMLQELHDREALLGKTSDEKDLIALAQKQRDEIKILADAHASFAQMDDATRIHTLESDALMAEQKKKNIEEQEKVNEQLYRREMELQNQAIEIQGKMYEDAWSKMMNISNMIGGEAGRGIGQFNMGMKGLFDIGTGRDQYSRQLAELQDFYGKKFELIVEGGAIESEINQANLEYQLAQQHIMQQQKLATYASYTNAVMGLLTAMGSFMGKHNKALFYMQQLAAIAITIVNTIAAAMAALAPPPLGLGPVAGIPLASAISAAGAMSVAAILAQTVTGGGGGKSVPMPGGGYIYNDANRPRFEQADKQKSQTINIYVNGNIINNDEYARELVPSIVKAFSDNVQ